MLLASLFGYLTSGCGGPRVIVPDDGITELDATDITDAIDAASILTCADAGERGTPPAVEVPCRASDQGICRRWAQVAAPPGATGFSHCDGRRCRRANSGSQAPDGTLIYTCGLGPECGDNQDCVSFGDAGSTPICVCIPP